MAQKRAGPRYVSDRPALYTKTCLQTGRQIFPDLGGVLRVVRVRSKEQIIALDIPSQEFTTRDLGLLAKFINNLVDTLSENSE